MSEPKKRQPRILRPGKQAMRKIKGRTVSAEEIRHLFAEDRIVEKARDGALKTKVVRNAHPSPPRADEPFCTNSQLIAYYDGDDNKIAEAHQYLRPDGKLGASRKPDPKYLVHNGELLYVAEPDDNKD